MPNDQIKLDYAAPEKQSAWRWWLWLPIILIGSLFLLSVFLPPSSKIGPRASARVHCASNLRQIGQAMLLYANDNGSKYPDHIEDLLVEEIAPVAFVCPSTNDTASAAGPTTQATQANFVTPGHCSYIYLGKGFTTAASAETILAYEPLKNHDGDGSNVLFGDGHVEFVEKQLMTKMLAELAAGQNPPRAEKLK